MLPNTEIVTKHYKGHFSNISKSSLALDCSTIDPIESRNLSLEAQKQGLTIIDAPVSGGVVGAQNATLAFMVGSPSDALFERSKAILSSMGKNIFNCKGFGGGQVAKTCNNMALAIQMISVSEALSLASKLGLDPQIMANIMVTASSRCWSIDTYSPLPGHLPNVPSSRDYERGFNIELQLKDLGIAMNSAKKAGAKVEMGEHATAIYTELNKSYPKKDIGYIYKILEQYGQKK
jgi:3-hydroxyisobutyrate dehydrogenase